MHAILLGYDAHVGFMQLVFKLYQKLWPDCPLQFRIPINNIDNPDFQLFRDHPKATLVPSPTPFRATAAALLEGIDDEAWVYWCISDRYPVKMHTQGVALIHNLIRAGQLDDFNAVRLVNTLEEVRPQTHDLGGMTFYHRAQNSYGFWHHQFCRAKVLKFGLLDSDLGEDYNIGDYNHHFCELIKREGGTIPLFERTLIPKDPLMLFGEPCLKNQLTKNGVDHLQAMGCPVPDLAVCDKEAYF